MTRNWNMLVIFDLCDRAMPLIVHSEPHLLLTDVKYYQLIATVVSRSRWEKKKAYYSCRVKSKYFENKKFDDITQQCFALLPQVNFPSHNLNFHWLDRIQAIFLNLSYFIANTYFKCLVSLDKRHTWKMFLDVGSDLCPKTKKKSLLFLQISIKFGIDTTPRNISLVTYSRDLIFRSFC